MVCPLHRATITKANIHPEHNYSTKGSYIAEVHATYFFTEFDVVKVYPAERWQLNSITVKLT